MCHAVRCRGCGKTTWAGCGAHADQVMARVRPEDRCACAPAEAPAAGGAGSASLWDAIKVAFGGAGDR